MCYIKKDYFKQEQELLVAITIQKYLLPKPKKAIYKFQISNEALILYLELKFLEEEKNITISQLYKVI
ncbi:hypothetical protein CLAN_0791 [Campylobacter lanienae NCTC 13004]|uniref:Uncharacterized protein n=1 Tax=Campylobacter lanienae NCTC 13004 TaxID=1031753 RepID=A0A1X9SMR5_9BACT|nr:hypothetical protein CLAN_0791 [Campylobacter lanienae NCTC 13004]